MLALAITLTAAPASAARLQPTSDLLLPGFEVDLDSSGVTTVFTIGNASDKPVEVLAALSTNRGLPILAVPFTLQAGEVRTVDLREWLASGVEDGASLAVGSLTLRTRSGRRDALWGDWSTVDAGGSALRGGSLVDIDRSGSHSDLCRHHLLRFDPGTEILVWREAVGTGLEAAFSVQDETRQVGLLALDRVAVADLGLREPSGSLRIDTEEDVYIDQAWCVADTCDGQRPVLGLNLLLDGRIADEPRGPLVDSGSQLSWTLVIENMGKLAVSEIAVVGLDATCPATELAAGESMECTATQKALSNPQSVPVMVTGRSACADVTERTTGYYEGVLVDVYP